MILELEIAALMVISIVVALGADKDFREYISKKFNKQKPKIR
jgi:hypothetical protein